MPNVLNTLAVHLVVGNYAAEAWPTARPLSSQHSIRRTGSNQVRILRCSLTAKFAADSLVSAKELVAGSEPFVDG
jgi:hypothetical protein